MDHKNQSSGQELDKILKKTIQAIEKSKDEIYDITEHARKEYQTIESEFIRIREQILLSINKVEELEECLKGSKRKLAEINKNFKEYTEKDMKKIYEETDQLRTALLIEKEREIFLIQQRNDLEIRYKNARSTLEKAENLMNQVGIALGFLSGDLRQISTHMEELKEKQMLGVKVLKAQEEERKRVAREIHDGPAQYMTNILLKVELCEKLIDMDLERGKEELKNLKPLVRYSIQDIRRIIYDLRPMMLEDLGLLSTLERYIKDYEYQNKIKVDFIVNGDYIAIENIIALSIFRIVQEALTNIKKHAESQNVKVTLSFLEDRIELAIIDDGKGFHIEEVKKRKKDFSSGFGLESMQERTELLDGKMIIHSEINKGTKYFIQIPLHKKEGK